MRPVLYLSTAIALRWAEMRDVKERDRGDSPVPTAVIILGMVVIAMAVTTFIFTMTNAWLDDIPDPADPVGGNPPGVDN
ncbi:hypothetical protein ACIBF5_04810 [Micromonospora sp. NPDC050417]|uniref:hypothetical protein n=1 Tax=Micromonospora sp. NPDC050417 TaxID=3364280 RepID=UPI0037A51699